MLIVNSNLTALNTANQLNINTNKKNKSIEKLSSGYRINKAADDTAGLAISEKMRYMIRGLNQGSKNVETNISFSERMKFCFIKQFLMHSVSYWLTLQPKVIKNILYIFHLIIIVCSLFYHVKSAQITYTLFMQSQ